MAWSESLIETSVTGEKSRVARMLLVIAVLLLGVGVVLLWLYLRPVSHASVVGEATPMPAVLDRGRHGEERPVAWLQSLGRRTASAALGNMLARDQWDAALVEVLYSTDLSDRERVGALLQISDAFLVAGRDSEARALAERARDLCVLSPSLPDLLRANCFLDVGKALVKCRVLDGAVFSFSLARLVVVEGALADPAQGAAVLKSIGEIYAQAGRVSQAEKLSQEAQELAADVALVEEAPVSPVNLSVEPSRELAAVIARRKQAVDLLIAALSGHEEEMKQRAAAELASWLQVEDRQRSKAEAFVSGSAEGLAWERVRWAAIKVRVAERGFGLSILPEWEQRGDELRRDLAAAYDAYLRASGGGYDRQGAQVVEQMVWAMRRVLADCELGLNPYCERTVLLAELQDAQERMGVGWGGFVIGTTAGEGGLQYVLLPTG